MTIIEILESIFIGPLKLIFEIIFSIANRMIGNPGLAIVVLSLTMNFLVLPLYRRADAMQEEARDMDAKLSKGIDHIKKTFSGDERMMILQTYYRQNHYSPLSALNGSVSLLLEIPFFMAAYQFLSNLTILNGVSFGPIADLGAPDGILVIGGLAINLLPILMTAINVISSYIYLKGFPLKTKIQLYAMAAFFLVFLYDSPSCLVFYWTMNNVFSLGKTIFFKLKNPGKVFAAICSALGLGVIGYVLFFYDRPSGRTVTAAAGLLLQMPLAMPLVKRFFPLPTQVRKQDNQLFFLGAAFLAVLVGLLIPSTFIAASPQEFVSIDYFYHPGLYLVSAACLAAGTFLVWMGVFYWLASPGGKVLFSRLVWVACGVMLMNYMFFGTDLGVISASLQYEAFPGGLRFSLRRQLINIGAICGLSLVLYLASVKFPRKILPVLLTAVLALSGMSALNISTINTSIQKLDIDNHQDAEHTFRLSKTGKNVVVFMLDRALGEYIPYVFEEKPELEAQFSGFTYYTNALSYGAYTNFAAPSLLGGYEYTPVEMNKRSDESLKDKHNEAVKLMPVLFDEAGYEVTVCNPIYANYQWTSDLSIFDDHPDINAFLSSSVLDDASYIQTEIRNNSRNFFCFSLMKTMPLSIQPVIYDKGAYNLASQVTGNMVLFPQTADGLHRAEGASKYFMVAFQMLQKLSEMTQITSEPVDTYLFANNESTHEEQLLQLPNYTPEKSVDNTLYSHLHENGIAVGDSTLKMETFEQVAHYHINMASLLQLGSWFDYLRENDVFDNTRIILISDHGRDLEQLETLVHDGIGSVEGYFPLMMVKDFGSTESGVSDEFMTVADVPSLAMDGLILDPVNPFTGKPITMDEKFAHEQFITLSSNWEVEKNDGNTFEASPWLSVKDNIWDPSNWTYYDESVVLDKHAAP